MQGRWLRFTGGGSRTPTNRTQKLSRGLLGHGRCPCRASRKAAVTSLFIRTPIRSQTNRKFYAPVSLLPKNVVYRAWDDQIRRKALSSRDFQFASGSASGRPSGLNFRRSLGLILLRPAQ